MRVVEWTFFRGGGKGASVHGLLDDHAWADGQDTTLTELYK
jgi:hypothetical protein